MKATRLIRPERRKRMGEHSREVGRKSDFHAGVDSLVAKLDAMRGAAG